MKKYFAILAFIFFLSSVTAAISFAQPYWVEVDVSPFAGSDFQLELDLYDNSGVVGDSWGFIDNIFIKGPSGVIERINFESGTLEAFDDSLNPDSVEVVAGASWSGDYMMRIDEDALVTPTIIWRDFLPSDATILHIEFEFISDGKKASFGQDTLVASLLSPITLEPLITGLKDSGDFLEVTISGNSVSAEVTVIEPIHPWDVNQDGQIDILDIVIVGRHFGETPPTDLSADVNQDGTVDILDLVIVGRHFGEKYGSAPAAPTVVYADSEPALLSLNSSPPKPGESNIIQLYLNINLKDSDLYGCQLELSFDAKVLEIVSITEGTMLNADSSTYWHEPTIQNIIGKATGIGITRLKTKTGAQGRGVLAKITLRIRDFEQAPISKLSIEGVKLINSNRQFIPIQIQSKTLIMENLLSPAESRLLQNYPNPFNPETWLPYQLDKNAPVTISIYNTKGQLIRIINLGNQNAGVYITKNRAAYWDARNSFGDKVASGVYFYTLQAGEFRTTRKMVILK